MGTEYHAICRDTKESIRLGRLYEWGGGDRRDWNENALETLEQVTVGYGYMLRLVHFMYDHQNNRVEVVRDEVLFDLKHEHPDWKELEEEWLKEGQET